MEPPTSHALRAYTPRDKKAVKTAAQTFRPNPALNSEQIITELGVGEALVSFLDHAGRPSIVEHAKILPPHSHIGSLTNDERAILIKNSSIYGKYNHFFDNQSVRKQITNAGISLFNTVKTLGNQAGEKYIRGLLGSLIRKIG